jgi:hypothetical protein
VQPLIVGETPRLGPTIGFRSHVEIYCWLGTHPEISDYTVFEWNGFGGEEPYLESAVYFSGDRNLDAKRINALTSILVGTVSLTNQMTAIDWDG